ncbi:Adenosine 3'-phospho 5'-phosphosulfate transporter 1 (PAPS transporter 1) (Solute carrier family 35 member B2) [Durusdinium trenchii]|uniref:Adenosine 3'-phospho 5'-phosphosulfate transporter 1 (PAPS transporter 1) (Solute carrier family 35 member B2) n=2 Tax=Durusdinium trenchii TaxID=1381693 RepID=A0ABP0SHP5_9DINO
MPQEEVEMPKGEKPTEEESQLRAALRCVGFASGVIIGLIVYGVLQERIMSEPYDNEIFRTSVFLVFMNRVAAILFALLMVAIQGESYKASVPLWKYLAVSLSNVAATWCQYEALKYVTFPVQMLGKSFKMMPVMVWGILISGQKYKATDWLIAAGVTGGVTAFLMTGDIKSKHSEGSSAYGLLLLCCFLACDGFTSTFQEKLFKEHKTSKYNQMLYVNGSSSLVSAATLLVSGGFFQAMGFIGRHPNFIFDASILSASAVTGQFFIYSLVKEFGALVLAATMNMRQVLSILTSYIKYSHPISFLQILSLCAVFASLFYKSYLSYLKGKQPKEPKTPGKAEAIGKASVEELQELKAEVPKEENENKN